MKIFMSPSCTSCRKARTWLKEHEIEFEERNIVKTPISKEELREILVRSENGTLDIVSTRSKVYEKFRGTIEDMTVSELVEAIEKHPSLLRRPIMIDEKRILVGYNEDEIRCFLPRKIRKVQMRYAQYAFGY